ncbi:MAG: phenylalanine--tRNA ligase subunit beta [Fusobacteria bacterium]|nr:phenylalanine--tRNA ligase subunit beta [Fusobacteriota bacterium]
MLVSLKWLDEYIDIKDKKIDELDNALTMIGQEVEKIEEKGKYLNNVVVGKIVEYNMHPEADKLTICKVDVGNEILQIICGAPNHKNGDKVCVAKVGAVLPGDFSIKKAKIRGVESCGMLCSQVELGIGTDGDGIIILNESAEIGLDVKKHLEIDDIIFELEITPNRPDCLSHIGIARELSAYYGKNIKYPQINIKEIDEKTEDYITIVNEAPDLCKRYVSRVVKNVKIEESPKWLKDKIESIGLRSINNIVDITNFVLMEYGHPLHAFDYDKIEDKKIIIKKASQDEKFITLDSTEHTLKNGELLIADGKKSVALAGVMGGKNTEVDNNTKNILLEVAHFDADNIRKTSKLLGISSDSSYRFERGIDINDSITVINRVASLIKEVAGGEILKGIVDSYVEKYVDRVININLDKLNKFTGKIIEKDKVISILNGLQLKVTEKDNENLSITPPSYRNDIICEADLFEEVIRMYGFENIEAVMPVENIQAGKPSENLYRTKLLKTVLKNIGLQEVINYSFIPKDAHYKINYNNDNQLFIMNPISEDMSSMRKTLIYSLLTNVNDNFKRNIFDINIFEVSKVFIKTDDEMPKEELKVSICVAGRKNKFIWDTKENTYDFFDLKGYVEDFFNEIGFKSYQTIRTENKTFHPGRAVDIYVGRDYIGSYGEIHVDVMENVDIDKERVYIAEFDVEKLFKYSKDRKKYKKITKYPAIERDIAVVLDEDKLVGDMINDIKKSGNIIENVELFDIYRSSQVGENKKSVAINIIFRDNKTLKDEEVNVVMDKILGTIEKKYSGELRK